MNETQQAPRRAIILAILAGLAAAIGIAAAAIFMFRSGSAPEPPPKPPSWSLTAPVAVPPPPADLLAAQAAAVGGDQAALATVEKTMRGYRAKWQGLPPEVAAKHAEADRLMDADQSVEAARAVAGIVETAPTITGPLADSRRILIQDAYFRLCRLALSAGQAIVTSVQTHQALALGEPANDPFVTNLLLVRAAASDRTGETAQATSDRARLEGLLTTTAATKDPGPATAGQPPESPPAPGPARRRKPPRRPATR